VGEAFPAGEVYRAFHQRGQVCQALVGSRSV